MNPARDGRGVFYAVLHSDDSSKAWTKNSGSIFSCPQPHHVRLDGWKHWRVALHQLICERPRPRSGEESESGAKFGDIVRVRLEEVKGLISPDGCIATFALRPRLPHLIYEGETLFFEPLHKSYFPLNCDSYPEFKVSLCGESDNPVHAHFLDYIHRTTLVLEFKNMLLNHRQEHVPLTLTSQPTADYPGNRANSFQQRLNGMYTNSAGNPWFVSLTSLTHSPRFLLMPSAHKDTIELLWQPGLSPAELGGLGFNSLGALAADNWQQSANAGSKILVKFEKGELEGKTNAELMHTLSKIFLEFAVPIRVGKERGSGRGSFTWECLQGTGGILQMSIGFAALFGFMDWHGQDVNDRVAHVFKGAGRKKVTTYISAKIFHPRIAYVHVNFVEPSSNGAQTDRLLALVPIPESVVGSEPRHVTREIGQLCYHKVSTRSLQHCTVDLRDKEGRLLAFADNEASLSMSLLLEINK